MTILDGMTLGLGLIIDFVLIAALFLIIGSILGFIDETWFKDLD